MFLFFFFFFFFFNQRIIVTYFFPYTYTMKLFLVIINFYHGCKLYDALQYQMTRMGASTTTAVYTLPSFVVVAVVAGCFFF
jgi:hypothetical protein